MKTLRELAYELDDEVSKIGAKVSTLEDVETLLCYLVESMDEAVRKEEEMLYYREHHTQLRVYWNLINYMISDLSKEYEKASDIKDELFKQVVKNGVHEKSA
ncbi:hypothetical protein BAMA_02050 [Bacillus manliponensis]|uniref:Uncharacterized protein n=1 Tax=Bacillus manliponensis TaxID=574376 RepID=A0A073JXA2_9BACI|nr:hypothetical protein [Bacillus manliponensis]KEK18881.1 hypothetical protein BAMA_02050 [Bacillus manliponensis]